MIPNFVGSEIGREIQRTLSSNRNTNGNIEIEFSFGEFSIKPKTNEDPTGTNRTQRFSGTNKTKPQIQYQIEGNTYNRIRIEFEEQYGSPQYTDVTDSMNDPSQRDVRKSYDNINNKIKWIKKTRTYDNQNKEYRFRFKISTETPINEISNFRPALTRRKYRHSYHIQNVGKLDLTKVESQGKETYELELEITPTRSVQDIQIDACINNVLKIVQGTNIVYSINEYRDVINAFNNSLKMENDYAGGYQLINSFMYNPRNLHYNDLVHGGLVGNPHEKYRVTHKTDGLRKFLMMTKFGLFLVYPPYEVNFITNESIEDLVGYIIEGELVPSHTRMLRSEDGSSSMTLKEFREEIMKSPKDGTTDKDRIIKLFRKDAQIKGQPYLFVAFDTLYVPENYDDENDLIKGKEIQRRPHPQRITAASYFLRKIMDAGGNWEKLTKNFLMILIKEFVSFENSEEFFRVMTDVVSLENKLQYKTDGYIFMPINMPYNSRNDKISLRDRVLTKNADICKYKPGNKMTIDFAIEWISPVSSTSPVTGKKQQRNSQYEDPDDNSSNDRRLQLLSNGYKDNRRSLVPFLGTNKKKLTDDMIDSEQNLIQNLADKTVLEYEWNEKKRKLQALRIRYDKPYPNEIEFAKDNWDLMFDPIPLELLEGSTLKLLRKYHNKIKSGLFDDSTERFNRVSGKRIKPNLLDIGSGRGGDVLKWKNFGRVVAVEPNGQHIESLKRRIAGRRNQRNIEVIENLEDVDTSIKSANERSDSVIIIKCGGEDTDLITKVVKSFFDNSGGKSDVVSMMLSLSFFWQTEKLLDQLIETITTNISSKGEFMFLTINGDSVEEMFRPRFNNGYKISELFMGPPGDNNRTIKMRVDLPNREVKINLRDTIVGTESEDQTEWLVKIDDLRIRLRRKGFGLKYLERADKEEFMTQGEKIFTKMYSYGKFCPLKEINIPRIIKETPKYNTVLPSDNIETPPKSPSRTPLTSPERTPVTSPSRSPSKSPLRSPQRSPERTPLGTPPKSPLRSPERTSKMTSYDLLSTDISDRVKSPYSGNKIPFLKVDSRRIEPTSGKAFGEDRVEVINCLWYTEYPVVRIATIGDGSCLVHSVLKSYYPPYSENPSYRDRVEMARQLRRDLGDSLEQDDPDNPGKTFYESFNDGLFLDLSESNDMFELDKLKKTFSSDGYLGDEAFNYLSQRLDIEIIIMSPYTQDLVQESGGEMEGDYTVFIGHVGECHYETLGVKTEEGIQTVFDMNDSFMIAYKGYRIFSEIRSMYNTILDKTKTYQDDVISTLPRSSSDLQIREILSSDKRYVDLREFLDQAEELLKIAQEYYQKTTEGSEIFTLGLIYDIRDNIDELLEAVRDIVDVDE